MGKTFNVKKLKQEEIIKKNLHSEHEGDMTKKTLFSVKVKKSTQEVIRNHAFWQNVETGSWSLGDTIDYLVDLLVEKEGSIKERPDGAKKASIEHGKKISGSKSSKYL